MPLWLVRSLLYFLPVNDIIATPIILFCACCAPLVMYILCVQSQAKFGLS